MKEKKRDDGRRLIKIEGEDENQRHFILGPDYEEVIGIRPEDVDGYRALRGYGFDHARCFELFAKVVFVWHDWDSPFYD